MLEQCGEHRSDHQYLYMLEQCGEHCSNHRMHALACLSLSLVVLWSHVCHSHCAPLLSCKALHVGSQNVPPAQDEIFKQCTVISALWTVSRMYFTYSAAPGAFLPQNPTGCAGRDLQGVHGDQRAVDHVLGECLVRRVQPGVYC